MASTRIVEEERGTYTGIMVHPHNGYYAGGFGLGLLAEQVDAEVRGDAV